MRYPTRLPPLNALRAFEATARLSTLAAAGEELSVTPSAISHQIRTLEDALGTPLFHRANRRLILTRDGQALQPAIADAFRRISAAVASLELNQRQGILTISMVETLAIHWFMPRLSLFNDGHPDIEVRISTTMRVVDFEQEDIDLAFRHGRGDWPGLSSVFLFAVETLPVCSPALLTGNPPLASPADLSRHILLHASARTNDWQGWLTLSGVPTLEPRRNLIFEKTNFALAAAVKGIGVAISDRHIVAEDLQSGRLVAPFTQTMKHDTGYYLVYPANRANHPKITLFRDWLLGEIEPR